MSKFFGKTWWGEHFLKSLDNIDYENRLPRGSSYARNDKVKKLSIENNIIMAKVQGTRPKPYDVTIIVPPFFIDGVEKLMSEIIRRPVIISKLLNRELDPEILQIAETLGLKVFPKQWTDFKMRCSCPDWAVPCKHLAAVIYMVSREIDNNPFKCFEIHNVDLIKELNNRGIFIQDSRKTEIPQFIDLLKSVRQKNENNIIADVIDEDKVYQPISFSKLQDVTDAMIQLLPESPPFYNQSNFKEKYSFVLRIISKEIQKLLNGKITIESKINTLKQVDIHFKTELKSEVRTNAQWKFLNKENAELNKEQLFFSLFQIKKDYLKDYQPSVAGLYQLFTLSLHLWAKGAVVPQIFQLDNKDYAIRWLPAYIDENVKKLIEKIFPLFSNEIVYGSMLYRKKEKYFSVANQDELLLSYFLTEIAVFFSRFTLPEDNFISMFFRNEKKSFNGIGEYSYAGGIKVWLDRYYLTSDIYKPVITIEETNSEDFEIFLSVEDTSQMNSFPIPLSDIINKNIYENDRFRILQNVSMLSTFIKGLDGYINKGAKQSILFPKKEFSGFLFSILPVIKLLGIKVLLPKSLQDLIKPKLSMSVFKNPGKEAAFLNLAEMLSFNWKVALGKEILSIEEYNNLLGNAEGLIKFKGSYIYISDKDIERIQKQLLSTKTFHSTQLLHIALSEEYEGAPVVLSDEVMQMIHELTNTQLIDIPEKLEAHLRPYQERGYSWLYKNSKIGFGSIIADDMGLGKTVQVIALLQKMKEEKSLGGKHKALVIVPTGLLTNWQNELNRFAPNLTHRIYHGVSRDFEQFKEDILITTYGMIRSDVDIFKKKKWQVLIIDEAQNIKNNETAQCKAVKSISSNVKIAMSGTPVENRLSEFWSIMDYTNKGYLGNDKTFKENFSIPIQTFRDEATIERFKKITAPFMLRRLKSDKSIISDLPDKIEQNEYCTLSKNQVVLYEKTVEAALDEIEGINLDSQQKLFKRQGLILQMILALKQICNHPTQFLKNGKFDASLSNKTLMLLDMLDSISERGEKVLIFTQFREMGDLLARFIEEKFGDMPMFYHGGCNVKQRQDMVEKFQNNRAYKIFILSLKAAGTGLNLTAASHVIHYDLWWNPAVEAQATDRAYRIGQNKNVHVHRFITKNTFEEKIDAMIQEKKFLAEMTVATGENWIGKLSNKELREIFTF